MSYQRSAQTPIEHLLAEMIAFPLASEAAFRLGLTDLHPLPSQNQRAETGTSTVHVQTSSSNHRTARLWREAERELLTSTPAFSIDELVSLRDRVWFGSTLRDASRNTPGVEPATVPLAGYLREISGWYLRPRGDLAVPCLLGFGEAGDESSDSKANKARSREANRYFSFALPPDLSLAASAGGAQSTWPIGIDTMAPQVAELLARKGFAECHLHMGGALDYGSFWISTLVGLSAGQIAAGAFSSPGAAFDNGREFGTWLLYVALARFSLAWFLVSRERSTAHSEDFATHFQRVQWPQMIEACGLHTASVQRRILRDLAAGELSDDSPSFAQAQASAAELLNAGPRVRFVRNGAGAERASPLLQQRILEADPIADPDLLPPVVDGRVSSEIQLVHSGLSYLTGEFGGATDTRFASLFWQCVRVRCLYYRHVVQRPLTPGLLWFIRTFDRLRPGKQILTPEFLTDSCFRLSGAGQGLKALEIRTAPDRDMSWMRELIQGAADQMAAIKSPSGAGADPRLEGPLLDAFADRKKPDRRCADRSVPCTTELGFVLHIVRSRGRQALAGLPPAHQLRSAADPTPTHHSAGSPGLVGYRFSQYFSQRKLEIESLARILLHFPLSLGWIRGIDACTDEQGIPTWVIAPFFRYLRDVSANSSAWLRHRLGIHIPPLRSTVHAGEDFVHLMGGLRRIDEVIRFLKLREGDRLGHCVALGIDATVWANAAGRVLMTREERLLDLAWEWSCYARDRVPTDVDRKAFVEREIARLSHEMFQQVVTPYRLELLVRTLHNERELAAQGFPDTRPGLLRPPAGVEPMVRELLRLFLSDRRVFLRGQATEWVDTADEASALERIQNYLRTRISSLGLTVEINPSSNLLIGDLGDLEHHPMWRLNPPGSGSDLVTVPVCIGSDDPMTFATSLPNEYTLLHDSIILRRSSSVDAIEWIDRIRETGLQTRFTLPNPDPRPFRISRQDIGASIPPLP